jgi:hypothetical protein
MWNLRASTAFAIVLFGASRVVGEPNPAAAPADPYVLSGYVPAGFSAFGTWTALRKVDLYSAVGSRKVVATADKCAEITAEDGEIRGRPREIRVVKSHAPLRKGERMWILARGLEEGYFQLWYRGAVRDELAASLGEDLSFAEEHCGNLSPKCWLWIDKDSPQEHWVRMRVKDGTVGWTRQTTDFVEGHANADNCP